MSRIALLSMTIVPIASCLTIVVRTVSNATESLHPDRQTIVRPETLGDLAGMCDVSFVTSDGLTLRGWYVPSRNHGAVILSHGWGQSRMKMLFEARCLAASGFGVLLFDSRAHGESDGALVTVGDKETLDLTAAMDFVCSCADVAPDRIGALGCSMGGFALADLAANDKRFRAVALSAMYTSLEDNLRSDYGRWGFLSEAPAIWAYKRAGVAVDSVRPIDAVGRIAPRPILFINGKHDLDSPVWAQDRLYAAAGNPKFRWDTENAEYGNFGDVAPDAYRKQIVAFFTANLLTAPISPALSVSSHRSQ